MKAGPLSDEEWEVMRRHPEIGARILEKSELGDIREWVLAHQERPDGMGYPSGLTADQIPLEAKILAVADAYEAMTTDRVYRRALATEVAQAELHQCAGTQFDAEVVDVFLRRLRTEEEAMAASAATTGGSNGRAVPAR
jgi:diguanylate cyclase